MIMDLERGDEPDSPSGAANGCFFCGTSPPNDFGTAPSLPYCAKCGFGRWFSSQRNGDFTVINPMNPTLQPDDLDTLLDVVTRMDRLRLELNLGGVQTIPSPVLAKLLNLKSLVRFGGGSFALVNLKEDLLKIFQLTHLDEVFEIR